VEQHHAGTGKHRRYAPGSAFDAAILSEIADIGVPVTRDYLRSALPLARGALRKWRQPEAGTRTSPFFSKFHKRKTKRAAQHSVFMRMLCSTNLLPSFRSPLIYRRFSLVYCVGKRRLRNVRTGRQRVAALLTASKWPGFIASARS
jgi:hypothetical protein